MKIVCEACGAKYSIADDRVAGKVFKIRCKRCSEVIVVRGDEQPQQAAAQPSAQSGYGAGAEAAIWHVVIDGEQAGPYAPSQLGEMLSAGTVTWEAYVWCEGFDNWAPMRDVTDLVAQITGQGGGQSAAEPAYAHAASSTLTGQPSMGADPFADDRDGGGGFGGRGAGPDLFGSSQDVSSPFSQDSGAVVASAPSPRVSPENAMTGARNENSVLFSLKNLQALATGSPSAPPVAAMTPDRSGGGGFAAGEGSGLIDIRALATATGVGDHGGGGARDELLSIGSQGGAFGALGSPMLTSAGGDDDGDKKTYIWAGVAAVGVLAIAGVAIAYIMTRQPPGGTQQQVQLVPPTAPAIVAPVAPVAPAPGAAPTEGELAAQQAKKNEANNGSGSEHHSSGSGHHHDSDKGETKGTPEAAPTRPSEPSEPAKPSKPSGPRTIDDLLDNALNGSPKPGKPAASAPAADLPQSPARDAVMSAMASVKGDVQACAKGETGVATVAVSIAGSTGRVTSAQVVTGPAGPVGSCIAQAVRKAQFPKFQQSVFKLSYPFKL